MNIDCIQHDKNEKQDRTSIAISAIAFGIIDKPFDGRSFEEMQKKKKTKQIKTGNYSYFLRMYSHKFVAIYILHALWFLSNCVTQKQEEKKNGGNYEFYLQL